ncbi:MAG: hypothetical protein MK108_00830 [Mariniblastus sp.]|nr:hypothetical protein [Mariniblastus sp.]
MKPTIFSHFRLPTLLLFTVIFSVPGCQTSKFPLPSLPGMSIWSGDKMDLTPRKLDTPSSQFHPEFANSEEAPASSAREDVQQKVDELIRSAEKEKQHSNQNQPLRQPYSLESIDPKMSQADTDLESNNSFEPVNTSQPNPPSANGFSMPGNQFKNLQNALNQLPPENVPQASPAQPAPKNSIPGWNNDFVPGKAQSAQPGSNGSPTNSFQPIPTQSGTSPQPISSAPAGNGAIPSNVGNGFDPPAMPKLNASPAPHNLLQPATPQTNNQFPATPQATIQLPLAPIPQKSGQPISVPDGGATLIGGISSPAATNAPARNVAPPADNSFGPIPFQKPGPVTEGIPGSLPGSLNAETVKPTLEANTSNGLPAALQMGSGGFAPGSIKQLKPADKN